MLSKIMCGQSSGCVGQSLEVLRVGLFSEMGLTVGDESLGHVTIRRLVASPLRGC